MLIREPSAFAELVGRCRQAGRFAFDTEFIRERRYTPQLCLVQIGVEGEAFAVDPFEVGDLSSLADLLHDDSVVKLVHAGQQDMEIFFADTDRVPRNVFDTQIAAALVGMGDSIGYSRLVEQVTGVRLAKSQTFTDWAQRPLSTSQLEYALEDVIHLDVIESKLSTELADLERAGWLEEELRIYEDPSFYRKDPLRLYERIKGAARLGRRELAVLRELARWRESEAAQLDRPRGHIVSDEVLVELSRMKPRRQDKMRALRGLHPQLLRRSGREILAAVTRALELSEDDCPPLIDKPSKDSSMALVVDLLEAFLKARAEEHRIAPGYLATRSELHSLARIQRGEPSPSTPRALSGWRRRLVGEDLVGLLEGRYHLGIEPRSGSVVVHPGGGDQP